MVCNLKVGEQLWRKIGLKHVVLPTIQDIQCISSNADYTAKILFSELPFKRVESVLSQVA